MSFWKALLEFTFLQQALVTSIAVGIVSGFIGCFIILRGMSLMGDAISHAVLPGVAISYTLGINLFIGAMVTGMLTALGIGFVSQNSRIKNDTAIGIIFSAAFALGIILIAKAQSASNLNNILFGNVLAVPASEMWLTIGVGAFVVLAILMFYKELLVSSFDPTIAAAFGLPNRLIHYMLMTLLTLVTVAALQTVGIVLVVAMLVTPAATAYLLTDRLSVMLWAAALCGVTASIIGLYFSFIYNLSSGPTIVLAATALFVLAFLFSPKHGVLSRRFRTRQQTTPMG